MNQENLSTLFKITILTCLFLIEKSSCVDPQFEACEPKSCGILKNISFPFWIQGQTESYCGFPGFFNITCNNDLPVLHIPDNDYIIHQIYYNNQSLRVSNYAVLDTNDQCFPPVKNVTLGEQFVYVYNNISIYNSITLLSKCSSPLPEDLLRYNIGCGEDWVLALFGNDKNLSAALEKCDTEIVAPIELYSENEISDGNYKGILRRGFELEWRASDCSACSETGGRCGFNSSSLHFRCFCPDRPYAWHCTPGNGFGKRQVIIAAVAASFVGTGIFVILAFFIVRRKLSQGKSIIFWKKKTENYRSVEAFLKSHGTVAPKRYNYSEVKKMTNAFKVKLGQGGYGSVYKGNLPNGCLVAVKVLNESKGGGEDFINEVASISRTSHVNIVTLLGFCFEGSKRALIYEFLPNGSLEKFIYEENPLTERSLSWGTLFQISVGIARGLEYLHRGCKTRILHFDIKPHNILLDEDFCPKISDFGLAKLCTRKESVVSMLEARGTLGYVAPEVFCRNIGVVSHKSDVYSYGMMVMEMVGGRKNIDVGVDHTSEIFFPHLIYKRVEQEEELGLHGINNDQERESARKMIVVSLWCIQTNPSDRPPISRVLEMLEGRVESLEVPPKPFLSSPSRSSPEFSGTLPL